MSIIIRYGVKFDTSAVDDDGNQYYDDLGIELFAIKKGPDWMRSKGLNPADVYQRCKTLIWPELDNHRWANLCRDTIVESKICVLAGCASSGKSHSPAWIYLLDYWANPHETCVLVSSTQIAALKKRIWAEMSMLWERGVSRYPKLAGNMLDSAIAITTDSIKDCDPNERKIRDMRRGIFGVANVVGGKVVGISRFVGIKQKHMRLIADEACFPAGTKIDTPTGKRNIELIKPGDMVINCSGACRVLKTLKRKSNALVKITTAGGDEIVCTPTHPLFTRDGWKNALHVSEGDIMVNTHEAMQIMRGDVSPAGDKLGEVQPMSNERQGVSMPEMRDGVYQEIPWTESEFLQSILRIELSSAQPGISREVLHQRAVDENFRYQKKKRSIQSRGVSRNAEEAGGRHGSLHGIAYSREEVGEAKTHKQSLEANWAQAEDSRRQRDWNDGCGEGFGESRAGAGLELCHQNPPAFEKRLSDLLQGGLCHTGIDALRGGRWEIPLCSRAQGSGCEENRFPDRNRVVGVEVYEQEDFGRYQFSCNGIDVYNLEVEGHPSYSVSGFLVHNSMMADGFLSAFANLNNNEDFKACVLGNPNDILDPLGKAAEPKGGWSEAYLEPTKTTVWETRFMNGRCVNLVGTDSPNFDFPQDEPDRYPYLISRRKIEETLSFFPKDSVEYYSQCLGVMKIGTISKRILSRELCERFHAKHDAVWKSDRRTRVYFVDASYGGDRCVGRMGEFGECVDGKIRLMLGPAKIIPIKVGTGLEPEDQIARFVKQDCEELQIPPENMGHDATGRGSLGTALAREWSAMTHPIDSGGRPTIRPVNTDISILEELETGEKKRRLKRCDEHYDRLVSEFWYSFRYAVEADQIRGLDEETMEEFCARKWDKIRGDKISIEIKDGTAQRPGMKQRFGKSPDLGDNAAGILEMARRKGFMVDKLGAELKTSPDRKTSNWYKQQQGQIDKFNKSRQLQTL